MFLLHTEIVKILLTAVSSVLIQARYKLWCKRQCK